MPRSLKGRSKRFARRLTGISTPFGGVSWNPPDDERDVIRRLFIFLEDRRVLFNPFHLEIQYQVDQSLKDIRTHLIDTLMELKEDSKAVGSLKAMAAACRQYFDGSVSYHTHLEDHMLWHDGFLIALGEVRAVFGIHIALLASRYNLSVKGDLISVLPAEAE